MKGPRIPRNAVERWYEGRLVPVEGEPDPRSHIRRLYYKRHWSAGTARVLVKFYLRNWQWIIGTTIAVVSLWVAVLAIKS